MTHLYTSSLSGAHKKAYATSTTCNFSPTTAANDKTARSEGIRRTEAKISVYSKPARASNPRTASASVLRMSSFRVVLSLAASLGLKLHLVDVVQAFLCAPLKEEVYAMPPEGSGEEPGTVWRLNKTLYGLRPAFAVW